MMHQPVCSCENSLCPATGGGFYVSVFDAGKRGLLLGPFETHEEALGKVPLARQLAERVDPWSHFYAFGTALMAPTYRRPGTLNDLARDPLRP